MRPGVPLLVSCPSGDGDQLILTTYADRWTSTLWLTDSRDAGAWFVAPPIKVNVRSAVACCGGWVGVYGLHALIGDQLKFCC